MPRQVDQETLGQCRTPNCRIFRIILVVEDDEPIAEAIVVVLEDAGYRPVWAANGQLALEAARSQWPDLILTDLMMPRHGWRGR